MQSVSSNKGANPANRQAFTLIEVLVVVAIIALLCAILLPSLKRARDQAKVTVCKANSKQIATMVGAYQSEFQGCVPIILNYYANGVPNHEGLARTCWLSIALRHYSKSTQNLQNVISTSGVKFDPNATWSNTLHDEYQNRMLPDFFMCPFERDKGPLTRSGPITDPLKPIDYYEEHGRYEAYQTAMWPFNVTRGRVIDYPWPGGAGSDLNGIAKYSTINWSYVTSATDVNKPSPLRDGLLNWRHRKWVDADSRDVNPSTRLTRGGGGLSSLVALFCAQGEHQIYSGKANYVARDNYRSHITGRGGGTNIIFADSHVEWVLGTRMGWP